MVSPERKEDLLKGVIEATISIYDRCAIGDLLYWGGYTKEETAYLEEIKEELKLTE